jgi:hypothetical protein
VKGEELSEILGVGLVDSPEFDLGSALAWRPTFGSVAERTAVYVCETAEVGASIARRVQAATGQGIRVVVALPNGLGSLTVPVQEFLLHEGCPIVIGEPDEPAREYGSVDVYAREQGVLLEERVAAKHIVRRLRDARTLQGEGRGKALEHALALMASQVPSWKVRQVNFHTSNEEVDVLVANNSARSPWNGGAYIMIEAKNWSSNVDRAEYDAFHMKVKERGGGCRLGLFVAAEGFSGGFIERASHHGSEGFSIVPMSVDKLASGIEAAGSVETVLATRVDSVVLDRQWDE